MGNAEQPCHVDACMVWFCPTALGETRRQLAEAGVDSHMPVRSDDYVIVWYIGLPVKVAPDLVALSNPETFIDANTPPFVIHYGRLDPVVPYPQGVNLARRLGDVTGKDRVRFTLFDDYTHADRRFETMHNCTIVLDQLEELLGG